MAPFGLLGSSSSVGDFSAARSLFVVENWNLFFWCRAIGQRGKGRSYALHAGSDFVLQQVAQV